MQEILEETVGHHHHKAAAAAVELVVQVKRTVQVQEGLVESDYKHHLHLEIQHLLMALLDQMEHITLLVVGEVETLIILVVPVVLVAVVEDLIHLQAHLAQIKMLCKTPVVVVVVVEVKMSDLLIMVVLVVPE